MSRTMGSLTEHQVSPLSQSTSEETSWFPTFQMEKQDTLVLDLALWSTESSKHLLKGHEAYPKLLEQNRHNTVCIPR